MANDPMERPHIDRNAPRAWLWILIALVALAIIYMASRRYARPDNPAIPVQGPGQ